MTMFTLNWEIDIDADTHESAAKIALEIMQDKNSTARCFTVIARDDMRTIEVPSYTPVCFDGRYLKWDGYVLDTLYNDGEESAILFKDGKRLKWFHCPIAGYEQDQEQYLKDMLETAKKWIAEQEFPAILQEQQH